VNNAHHAAGVRAEPVMLPRSARTSVSRIVPRQGFAAPRCARPWPVRRCAGARGWKDNW